MLFFRLENWTENPACMFTFWDDNMLFLCEKLVVLHDVFLVRKLEKKSSLHVYFP